MPIKYKIIREDDGNVEIELDATNSKDATAEALEKLGWNLVTNDEKDEEDTEGEVVSGAKLEPGQRSSHSAYHTTCPVCGELAWLEQDEHHTCLKCQTVFDIFGHIHGASGCPQNESK